MEHSEIHSNTADEPVNPTSSLPKTINTYICPEILLQLSVLGLILLQFHPTTRY